jgi:hypothetical protein
MAKGTDGNALGALLTRNLSRIEPRINAISPHINESGAKLQNAFPSEWLQVVEAQPLRLARRRPWACRELEHGGPGRDPRRHITPSSPAIARGVESGWHRSVGEFRKPGLDLSGDVLHVRNPEVVKRVNGVTKGGPDSSSVAPLLWYPDQSL